MGGTVLAPPSPNWYSSHAADCSSLDDLYAYAAHTSVVVFSTAGPHPGIACILCDQSSRVLSVSIAHDTAGRPLVLASGSDRSLKLWKVEEQRCVRTLTKLPAPVTASCVCRASDEMSTPGADEVALPASNAGEELERPRALAQPVVSASSRPASECVALGDQSGLLSVWALATSKRPVKVSGFKAGSAIAALASSPHHSSLVAVGSAAGAVWVVDWTTGEVAWEDAASLQTGRDGAVQSMRWEAVADGKDALVSMLAVTRAGQSNVGLVFFSPARLGDASARLAQVGRAACPLPAPPPGLSNAQRKRQWLGIGVCRAALGGADLNAGPLTCPPLLFVSGHGGSVLAGNLGAVVKSMLRTTIHKALECGDSSSSSQASSVATHTVHLKALSAFKHSRTVFTLHAMLAGNGASHLRLITSSMDRSVTCVSFPMVDSPLALTKDSNEDGSCCTGVGSSRPDYSRPSVHFTCTGLGGHALCLDAGWRSAEAGSQRAALLLGCGDSTLRVLTQGPGVAEAATVSGDTDASQEDARPILRHEIVWSDLPGPVTSVAWLPSAPDPAALDSGSFAALGCEGGEVCLAVLPLEGAAKVVTLAWRHCDPVVGLSWLPLSDGAFRLVSFASPSKVGRGRAGSDTKRPSPATGVLPSSATLVAWGFMSKEDLETALAPGRESAPTILHPSSCLQARPSDVLPLLGGKDAVGGTAQVSAVGIRAAPGRMVLAAGWDTGHVSVSELCQRGDDDPFSLCTSKTWPPVRSGSPGKPCSISLFARTLPSRERDLPAGAVACAWAERDVASLRVTLFASSGAPETVFLSTPSPPICVACAPSALLVACGCESGEIAVAAVQVRQTAPFIAGQLRLVGHRGPVTSLGWLSDAELVSCSEDQSARRWRVSVGDLADPSSDPSGDAKAAPEAANDNVAAPLPTPPAAPADASFLGACSLLPRAEDSLLHALRSGLDMAASFRTSADVHSPEFWNGAPASTPPPWDPLRASERVEDLASTATARTQAAPKASTRRAAAQRAAALHCWRGDVGAALDVLAAQGALNADFVALAAGHGREAWRAAAGAWAAELAARGDFQAAALYLLALGDAPGAVRLLRTRGLAADAAELAAARLPPGHPEARAAQAAAAADDGAEAWARGMGALRRGEALVALEAFAAGVGEARRKSVKAGGEAAELWNRLARELVGVGAVLSDALGGIGIWEGRGGEGEVEAAASSEAVKDGLRPIRAYTVRRLEEIRRSALQSKLEPDVVQVLRQSRLLRAQ